MLKLLGKPSISPKAPAVNGPAGLAATPQSAGLARQPRRLSPAAGSSSLRHRADRPCKLASSPPGHRSHSQHL